MSDHVIDGPSDSSKKRKLPTRSSTRLSNASAESVDPAGHDDPTTPAPTSESLTLFSLKYALEHLNSHPDQIESCWVELSAEQQVVDMWYLLTPSPEHAQALSTYYHAIVRYRKCRGITAHHFHRAIDQMSLMRIIARGSTVNEGKRAMMSYQDLMQRSLTQKLGRLQVAACQKMLDYMLFLYFKSERMSTVQKSKAFLDLPDFDKTFKEGLAFLETVVAEPNPYPDAVAVVPRPAPSLVANKPVATIAPSEQASLVDHVEGLITKPVQSIPRLTDIIGNHGIISDLNGLMLQAHMNFEWDDPNETAMASFLLFGPPGCGKTSIARALAHANDWTLFHVTEGSLKSKWFGDSEKLVDMLFKVAKDRQPSIIFFDEIEGLCGPPCDKDVGLTKNAIRRSLLEHWSNIESSTERIIIIGATNHPKKIDGPFWSRFENQVFIPLPDKNTKKQLIAKALSSSATAHNVSSLQIDLLASASTRWFSGREIVQTVVAMQRRRKTELLTANLFVKTLIGGAEYYTPYVDPRHTQTLQPVDPGSGSTSSPNVDPPIRATIEALGRNSVRPRPILFDELKQQFETTKATVKEGDLHKYQR